MFQATCCIPFVSLLYRYAHWIDYLAFDALWDAPSDKSWILNFAVLNSEGLSNFSTTEPAERPDTCFGSRERHQSLVHY